jgi:hypothetical protein
VAQVERGDLVVSQVKVREQRVLRNIKRRQEIARRIEVFKIGQRVRFIAVSALLETSIFRAVVIL